MSASTRAVRSATGMLALALVAGVAVLTAPAAHADAPAPSVAGVSASCSSLTVKPKGFADKAELRVVVDGEVQTDGSLQRTASGDDWRVFTGSFPGVYAFDPRVSHTYSIEINSFSADSQGRTFVTGTGSDSTWTGTTTPCDPVSIRASASNCTNPDRLEKQGLDLTIGDLRRSTTYLVEVLEAGTVVKHFQFRTQPEVTKHFSGLRAGVDYTVRVTDQSDEELSSAQRVLIPGCAAAVDLATSVSSCAVGADTRRITADLGSLVVGRGYDVALVSTASTASTGSSGATTGLPVVSLVGDDLGHRVEFSGVARGSYRVEVSDDAAARVTRSGSLDLGSCAAVGGNAGTDPWPSPGPSAPVAGDGDSSASTASSAAASTGPSTSGVERAGLVRDPLVSVKVDGSTIATAQDEAGTTARVGAPTASVAPEPKAAPALAWVGVGGGLAVVGAAVWLAWFVRRRRGLHN